ncbi:type VI secretion system membrane subunit TssM [Neptunomonas sp.]|uniref:type VI secretion system membrane subunit TssM n=1 Tax=Neptunomonas sp. TaxID=1971898 RepID=UPI0025EFD2FF|nr:type VI secretion system membrane subunit TssM [Neptunomonas sp.]
MRLSSIAGKLKNLLGFVALITIGALIWFVLPAITMGGSDPFGSAMTRGLMIGSMFGMALIYKLRGYLMARKKNEQLATEMTSTESAPKEEVGKREVEELSHKFDEALGLLKKVQTKEGGKGSYLYVLPWYVIIGPSGSGKTTALLNSDLHFPLMDSVGASVKGVGGTRNCDWWFTDEAVLLDTAGRYTTQNNQSELDEVEWKGFLGLLKKLRSRKPINGLIITFPVDSLLKMQESDLITHAKFIKQRIQEFQNTFQIRFPVYVSITKFDMLPGFTEYFDDLGREEREQVWGFTYPYNDDNEEQDAVQHFLMEFRTLQERIQSREADRLQMESDIARRDLIYVFPRTLGLLQDPIATFLQEIFKPTRFETQPLLRGVYFNSGTQDGTTLDRVVNALGSRFGLRTDGSAKRISKGKGYFLHNLFTKVIFRESGLAGINIKHARRLFILHTAAYGLVFSAAVVISGFWLYGFQENRALIANVEAKTLEADGIISDMSRYEQDILVPVESLNTLRALPTGYAEAQEDESHWLHFGLYQGDKLGQEATDAYGRLLYQTFLPRLLVQVETALYEKRNNAEYLYDTLRVYLMLSDPSHLDIPAVKGWVLADWKRVLPRNIRKAQYENLQTHLDALLEYLPKETPLKPNAELVSSVRTLLSTLPPARRFYFRLKQEGIVKRSLEPYRMVDAIGSEAAYLFQFKNGEPITSEINGFYTKQGYQHYFLTQRDGMIKRYLTDEWVMGKEYGLESVGLNGEALQEQVESLYLDDYLNTWRNYIEALDFAAMNNPRKTLAILKELSRADSPIIPLLSSIRVHTSADAFSLLGEIEGDAITDIFGESEPENIDPPLLGETNVVIEYFAALNEQTQASEDRAAPIEETIKMLDELYIYMSAIEGASNKGKVAFEGAADPMGSAAVLRELDVAAARQSKPLSTLLDKISDRAKLQTAFDAKKYMGRQWENDVAIHCNNMITKRYPFNKKSRSEATLDDVSAYFGPGGIVENYFQNVVVDFVDTSHRPWRWNKNNGVSLGFSEAVLRQLEIGRMIRDTFYRTGSSDPSISFELRPTNMDKSILRMSLFVNGQQMTYAHGPQGGKRFRWPDLDRNSDRGLARLVIVTSSGQESITEQGDWALFRLFDKAKIKRIDRERYKLTFTLKNEFTVSLELRAGSVYNPFQMAELSQVRCN